MIFYLAALQSIPPSLAEAASIEGASRVYYFRRVVFPLLMPTTLFVLVNAVINSFRLVDHIVVMTKGGPNNATSLLLFHIYQVGFSYWDTGYAAALTVVLLAILAAPSRSRNSISSSAGCITNEEARDGSGVAARVRCGSCRSCTRSGRHSIRRSSRRASRSPHRSRSTTSATPGKRRPFARYFLNSFLLVTMVLVAQTGAVHARGLFIRALRISRARTSPSRWCSCSS